MEESKLLIRFELVSSDTKSCKDVYVAASNVKDAWDRVAESYPLGYLFHGLEVIASSGSESIIREDCAHLLL